MLQSERGGSECQRVMQPDCHVKRNFLVVGPPYWISDFNFDIHSNLASQKKNSYEPNYKNFNWFLNLAPRWRHLQTFFQHQPLRIVQSLDRQVSSECVYCIKAKRNRKKNLRSIQNKAEAFSSPDRWKIKMFTIGLQQQIYRNSRTTFHVLRALQGHF